MISFRTITETETEITEFRSVSSFHICWDGIEDANIKEGHAFCLLYCANREMRLTVFDKEDDRRFGVRINVS